MGEQYEGIRYLAPHSIRFHRNDVGQLCARLADGTELDHVLVYRTLPISAPRYYISIRVGAAASEQREIGLIRDLAALAPEQRDLLLDELARRYFIHIITRIRSIEPELGYLYWTCETDKGLREFAISRGNQSKVLDAGDGCRILTDVDGNRYEIPDLDKLDADSRARFLTHVYW